MDELIQRNIDHYNTMLWLQRLYKGLHLLKFDSDLEFYEELLAKYKPEVIIETGTLHGGSALWFADHGIQVITIDIDAKVSDPDPRITYITGSSVDPEIAKQVKQLVKKKKVMVVLDADHTKAHVEQEIALYAPMVSKHMPFVIEDTMFKAYFNNKNPANEEDYSDGSASDAVEAWSKKGFKELQGPEITMNPGGWWLRK